MAGRSFFSRSNVNEKTLNISPRLRSSFDLSRKCAVSPKLGRFTPVSCEPVIPGDIVSGSVSPNFSMEDLQVPDMGRVRLDTHSFFVSMFRINRDFPKFYEGNLAEFEKPCFDWNHLCGDILRCLFLLGRKRLGSDVVLGGHFSSWAVASAGTQGFIIDDRIPIPEGPYIFVYNGLNWINPASLLRFCATGYRQLAEMRPHHSLSDFMYVENLRLLRLADSMDRLDPVDTSIRDYSTALARCLLEVLRPYVGSGSVMECLGYPKVVPYVTDPYFGALITWIEGAVNKFTQSSVPTDFVTFLKMRPVLRYSEDSNEYGYSWELADDVPSLVVCEDMIRAAYISYYDYLRDKHIEPRGSMPNPDNFSGLSLLASLPSTDAVTAAASLSNVIDLLVLRYRYWGRDGLTTIQVDDPYRHVFVPILNTAGDPAFVIDSDSLVGDANDDSRPGLIHSLLALGSDPFGSELTSVPLVSNLAYFSSASFDVSEEVSLRQDLQVMRRCGMLEKYLARHYYFNDNYVGNIEADFSVNPTDFGLFSAQYLGGDENFVSGEQQKADVGTDFTPAGHRTLTAGVQLKDSFSSSYRDHGYIISFVSMVPLQSYDAVNPHIFERFKIDLPLPDFADDTRVIASANQFVRGFEFDHRPIGYVPRYYSYRVHLDELHGDYLEDKQIQRWSRNAYNMIMAMPDGDKTISGFALNALSMHIHPDMSPFLNKQEWDSCAYGDVTVDLFFDRELSAAIEFI